MGRAADELESLVDLIRGGRLHVRVVDKSLLEELLMNFEYINKEELQQLVDKYTVKF